MTQALVNSADSAGLLLTVRLGEAVHAVPIEAVAEVLPALPLSGVPLCPDYVRGVAFVRGHLIPVIDLARRLNLDSVQASDPHIVCVECNGRLIGFEVDEALDLISPLGDPLAVEDLGGGNELIQSVIEYQGQMISVLDPSRLIPGHDRHSLDHVSRSASAPLG